MSYSSKIWSDDRIIGTLGLPDQIDRLRAIMLRLRQSDGCPWDIEQTHESLIPYMIEETYEVVDAIHEGDKEHLKEELGDLLLQSVFHAQIAEDNGDFSLDLIAFELCEKLVRRHPHVFAASGSAKAEDSAEVLNQWELIKQQERLDKGVSEEEVQGYLSQVGLGLPPLLKAYKIQRKVSKVGFEWSNVDEALEKLEEEIAELKQARDKEGAERYAEEVGDALFAMINVVTKSGLHPDELLHKANQKFTKRFHAMESELVMQGTTVKESSRAEMLKVWNEVKDVK